MGRSYRILGGLAVAGLVVAGSSAFTAAGVVNSAGTTQFVGGQVAQTVTGAVLTNVVYHFVADQTGTVDQVTLTFTFDAGDTSAHPVTLVPSGSGSDTFTCSSPTASGTTPVASTCTADSSGYTGLTGIAVTVA